MHAALIVYGTTMHALVAQNITIIRIRVVLLLIIITHLLRIVQVRASSCQIHYYYTTS
jgi:hypothetical protein